MQGKDIYSNAKKGQTLMAVRETVRVAKTAKSAGDVTWAEIEEVRLVDERRYAIDRPVYKMWQPKPVSEWQTTTANSYGYLVQSVDNPQNYRVIRSSDFVGTRAELKVKLDEKQRVKEQWEAERKERQRIQEAIKNEAQERVTKFVDSAKSALTDLLGEEASARTFSSVSYNLDDNMQPKLSGYIGIQVEDWQAMLHILMQAKAKSDA
jgi:hypothetical protein